MASGSKTIAIGDVHGCAEELKALVHKLPLDQDTTIIFLGDYVDRGPDAKGVIDTLLDLSQLYKVVALKGNHEWLMEQFLAKPEDALASGNFILNGGSATLASYSEDGSNFTIPASHRKFLSELKLFHATGTHFFVHAGIPPDYDFSGNIDGKTAHHFLWIRNVFLNSRKKWPKVVVHGHTPVPEPEILENRINLDTGCVFGKKLTAMVVETGELFSVDRNQTERPTFLVQTLRGGVARAKRFAGEVPVELQVEGSPLPFRTVNYNEFGVLLAALPGAASVSLQLGDKVDGLIRLEAETAFRFEGTVVRIDAVNGVPHFGIRFGQLVNLAETP